MKKYISAFLALLLAALLTGCGDGGASKTQSVSANSVSAVMEQQMQESGSAQEPETPQTPEPEYSPVKNVSAVLAKADIDLTKLSSTMVYSEVFNMLNTPEDYIGKTVRMNGPFVLFQGADEYGEAIPDAIYFACCSQGLEFILGDGAEWPKDYPAPGTGITVTGVFETYMEGDIQYCHLVNAKLS